MSTPQRTHGTLRLRTLAALARRNSREAHASADSWHQSWADDEPGTMPGAIPPAPLPSPLTLSQRAAAGWQATPRVTQWIAVLAALTALLGAATPIVLALLEALR